MWEAKNWFVEARVPEGILGYFFTCPACGESLDMLFRTMPYSEEFRKKCIEQYKYDPEDNVWERKGDRESGNLTLHPSIVHMGCRNGGHYWIRDGMIINC